MATLPSTSQAPEWATQESDLVEDLDEPPELRLYMPTPKPLPFQRSPIRPKQVSSSLLTQAILGQSDEEDGHVYHPTKTASQRRRSIVSNASIASTADLTSDTGMTSPSRTNTPSPPLPDLSTHRLHHGANDQKPGLIASFFGAKRVEEPAKEAPRKRCIQFACAAKPQAATQAAPSVASPPKVKTPLTEEVPKRCIKFACPARPSTAQKAASKPYEPSTPKRSMTHPLPTSPRPSAAQPETGKASLARPRFLRASSTELIKDASQFHEFASGMAREDDWIRQENSTQAKLTISDTLVKENLFRRLGAEDDELDVMDNEDEDEDEDELDDNSDGYHTDEETGFADSDEEDDGDENMILWTPGRTPSALQQAIPSLARRLSMTEQHSDSSIGTRRSRRRSKARPIGPQVEAPDLPDSTDFVCGTLDEDRPVEDAYLSCLAARRLEKLRIIPQDIDPSFPASDLEEEDDDDVYAAAPDSDEHAWVQGAMEDLGDETDRARRRRKNENTSPRRLRSPPPKRRGSPAPKPRARSPKPLFDRQSPRRARSPAPKAMAMATPIQTPRQGAHAKFQLAGRPGLTHTKSLPRPAALFRHQKPKGSKTSSDNDAHIRTAIDIVKGLEKKRLRRKEKFFQKYCDRARRGQIPERKPLPGLGAERMRELGLLMAGKKDPGNYVLSC
ncbi:hypothetical protein BBK36DRAFT_53508 [Trichoderma citrinoviride]|uniref:Uncharacterized protein n=1 Tax=Trichoderma citrinoviride TaxID=58853 RepID=A0A2T4BAJ5_9HYPO|nr:hypothetical protein BBK36DRAFT_53508 [Trichoderma citrinoviride]PTB66350.1 hypothetical protein BBK36DRAFT_53508 [Trichoderma citrinoviride]